MSFPTRGVLARSLLVPLDSPELCRRVSESNAEGGTTLSNRMQRASGRVPRRRYVVGAVGAAGLLGSLASHFISHLKAPETMSSASPSSPSITVTAQGIAIGQVYGGQIILASCVPLAVPKCAPERSVSSEVRKAPVKRIDRPHPAVLTQIGRNAIIPADVEIGPPKPARSQLAQDKASVREVVAFQGGRASSAPVYAASAYSTAAFTGPEHGPFMEMGVPPFNTYTY